MCHTVDRERVYISIHALLAESDKSLLTRAVSSADFYPRSPCGERPPKRLETHQSQVISIHALLAESDSARYTNKLVANHFYPRSPCGERQRTVQICCAV